MDNQDVKNNKELIKLVLGNWDFPVLKESDNSLVFRYQLNHVQANLSGCDGIYALAMTLTSFFTADDEREMFLALRACNELNSTLLHTKFYVDSDADLVVSSEFFYTSHEDVDVLMKLGLDSMIAAKKRFLNKYEELDDSGVSGIPPLTPCRADSN